ncbi:MAG: ABC transporter permease [Ectothiorhodospiraceae bacterium]|nr:ABC transporter permease [Ectothiorhodospiraceae bacterium]
MPIGRLLALAWRDLRASGRSLWVLCACLALGVTLIAASGGLFHQVSRALLDDTRALFGGDVEVRDRQPLPPEVVRWMESRGQVSLLIELRTMLSTPAGRVQLAELQSYDAHYPLYGEVELNPPGAIAEVLAPRETADGIRHGVALDPVLATRLGVGVGDVVEVGMVDAEVRALIARQPDRSLRADWRGPPVLVSADVLPATELIQPGSRVAYRYRVRTDEAPATWRSAFATRFTTGDWEVRTFTERSERIAEVLGQVASGLLLIGFSALFVGGLGVFNSVHAYLQRKLATIATLRALGLRDRRLAAVYLIQIGLLAGGASLAGTLAGGALALAGASVAAERLPVAPAAAALVLPLTVAWLFGVLTALTFALPAIGRALSVSPAALFRGIAGAVTATPRRYWWLTAIGAALTASLVVAALPQPLFGAGFIAFALTLLVLLEGVVRGLRLLARRLLEHPSLEGRLAARLAVASLAREGSPLRPALLSLGSALTLLVASTLVVFSILRTIDDTIPERAPALVFYDISASQLDDFRAAIEAAPSLTRLDVAPLVLGRLSRVNGEQLRDSTDEDRRLEARDEHKLSYRAGNFDNVVVERGAWWPDDYRGPPQVAMEDREADQLGLAVGDRLRFDILGETLEADLVAIYGQRRFEARFWLEGIFSDGALDRFVTRYVATAYMSDDDAVAAQARLAGVAPNVVTVRTAGLLAEARGVLARASAGLAVLTAVSLTASLLVLASALAACRVRQVYDATVLHTLGARQRAIRQALAFEHTLLALVTSAFGALLGGTGAAAFVALRLELATGGGWWLGAVVATVVSVASLGLAARHLARELRVSPALLLRAGG